MREAEQKVVTCALTSCVCSLQLCSRMMEVGGRSLWLICYRDRRRGQLRAARRRSLGAIAAAPPALSTDCSGA